jgi:1-deoxy-D-xylulose-5-phosphate synthase
MVLPGGLFEDLGIRYFGPVNGHDIEELTDIFKQIKNISGPRLVHVITEKGHGWEKSENDSFKWHSSTPFHLDSGKKKQVTVSPSMAQVFGEALLEIAQKDKKVVAITAAMPDGTGVDIMQKIIPDRVIDVGIAEQYAVTFSAGMACQGMKPVVAIYSCFLQRAFDQVVHDVAMQKLPVTFVMSHSGLVGVDGPTHHGAMDLTYLRMIPNMTIMSPSCEKDLRNMLYTAYKYNQGPIAIRYPKANALSEDEKPPFAELEIGKPRMVKEGNGLLILSVGHMLKYAKTALEMLEKEGHNPTLVDVRFVKPLDPQIYHELIAGHTAVLTIEDNVISGGYGSGISELMAKSNLYHIPIKHIGLPDTFVTHGDLPTLYASLKMDAQGIFEQASGLLKQIHARPL